MQESQTAPRDFERFQTRVDAYRQEMPRHWNAWPDQSDAGRALLALSSAEQIDLVAGLVSRAFVARQADTIEHALVLLRDALLKHKLTYSAEDLEFMFDMGASNSDFDTDILGPLLGHIETFCRANKLTPALQSFLEGKAANLSVEGKPGDKLQARMAALLGPSRDNRPMPGEVWADEARADLDTLPETERAAWNVLLAYALTLPATGKAPTKRWEAEAHAPLSAVGPDTFLHLATRWFHAVALPQNLFDRHGNAALHHVEKNVALLRGLIWCAVVAVTPSSQRPTDALAGALGHLTETAYQSVPSLGPWAATVGNAGIAALGRLPGATADAERTRLQMCLQNRAALTLLQNAIDQAATTK